MCTQFLTHKRQPIFVEQMDVWWKLPNYLLKHFLELILDLQKSCENSTELAVSPLLTIRWSVFTKLEKLALVHCYQRSSRLCLIFLKDFIFFFRERGRGGEREEEKHQCTRDASIHLPSLNQGPGLQPRHVLWQEIQLATFQFTGRHSIHWDTPSRATWYFNMLLNCTLPPNLIRDSLFHLSPLLHYIQVQCEAPRRRGFAQVTQQKYN